MNLVQKYMAIVLIVIALRITDLEAEHKVLDVSSDISLGAAYLINKRD